MIMAAILMAFITFIGFNSGLTRFFFASGSDGLMRLIESDLYIRIILLVLFFLLVFLIKKWKWKIFYYPAMSIVFGLWLLSGRMIALFPDGRLISGWFYMETSRVDICKDVADCEKTLYYETSYRSEFLWKYRIKNKELDFTIFASPFIKIKIEKLFSQQFAKSNK